MVAIMNRIAELLIAASFVAVTMAGSAIAQCPNTSTPVAVTTYKYDNLRTGWSCNETQLTPANVATPSVTPTGQVSFGLLHSVTLDDQVDAQPLFVPHQTITFPNPAPLTGGAPAAARPPPVTGIFDTVYVATESNTIYAIDAASGNVLLQKNLGIPVTSGMVLDPFKQKPCTNNGLNIGINGTPVIDRPNNVMYVIAFSYESPNFVYRIHELDLGSLVDKVPPVVVTATHLLYCPQCRPQPSVSFSAYHQRQRAGLALVNGNVYAGFTSWCDWPEARGWLLGWSAGSLVPFQNMDVNDVQLNNFDTKAVQGKFLASVWMSGSGIAADESLGYLYFVTGNSNSVYNPPISIQESVVKLSLDLTIHGMFTPPNHKYLDDNDGDFGSGGVMLLPKQPGAPAGTPDLAVAAGKYELCPKDVVPPGGLVCDGINGGMYLLDRTSMAALFNYQIGECHCGPSYFHTGGTGNNAAGHVVSSGGLYLDVWQVQTPSSAPPSLIQEYSTPVPTPAGASVVGDPGFFTSISSNGETGDAIIWAVPRPEPIPCLACSPAAPGKVWLYAFKASQFNGNTVLTQILKAQAGTWTNPSGGANANIVPVVANGRVFVASYGLLNIFGLSGSGVIPPPNIALTPGTPQTETLLSTPTPLTTLGSLHVVYGTIVDISGSQLTIRLRTKELLQVDATAAIKKEQIGVVFRGRAIVAQGTYAIVAPGAPGTNDAKGIAGGGTGGGGKAPLLLFHADAIAHAKPPPWPADR